MRVLRMRADRDGDPAPSAAPTLFFRLTDRKMKTNIELRVSRSDALGNSGSPVQCS